VAQYWTDKFSYVTGAVRYKDLAYMALVGDEVAEKKISQSHIMEWDAGTWRGGEDTTRKWEIVSASIAVKPREQAIFLGEGGQITCLGSGDTHDETIETKDSSPKNRGPLRGIRRIGESVYAVGMDRQVYRRDALGRWSCIDQWARKQKQEDSVTGFEAIDGFDENEIYAVGWDGEIWLYDGAKWSQKNSPTNLVLVHVCCGPDGNVYACGRVGTLLRGRGDKWDIIRHESITDDIWNLAWYDNHLYFSTMSGVYMLEGDEVRVVGLGDLGAETFFHLSAADGVLWSIGAKDVLAFDGESWVRID